MSQAVCDQLSAQFEQMRPTLLRLATLQLRNNAWAEDAVSETLVAAIEGAERFAGQSQLQTWVVGILKHKVLDQLRLRQREDHLIADDDDPEWENQIYTADGHFRDLPHRWGGPEESLQQIQFFQVLEACMASLPGQLGRVFLMREWLELDTDSICQELQISATNVWQMLSRARLRLRQCLQQNWFDPAR